MWGRLRAALLLMGKMLSLDTYTELKQSVIDWLDRDDLVDRVDDFIDIAEARHRREIRIREMLVRDPLTVVSRYASLPTGYLAAKTIRLLTSPKLTVLKYLNLHEMNNRRVETPNDKPLHFTVHNQIEFDRIPDQSYSGELIYYKRLNQLSTTVSSNALLSRAPDIYLWSALAASAPFLMNDERIVLWETLYTDAKDTLNTLEINSMNIGPVVSQVSGWTP